MSGLPASLPHVVLHRPILERYRFLIIHLSRALQHLPSYTMTQVYRGLPCRVPSQAYARGRYLTWTAFSSTTASAEIVRRFVGASEGSVFMLRCTSGRSIRDFRCTCHGVYREPRGLPCPLYASTPPSGILSALQC